MAIDKAITNADKGTTATYWRVLNIAIDAVAGKANVVLGGYASAEIRARPAGQAIDVRHLPITGPAFYAMATAPSLPVSAQARAAIEAHAVTAPPVVAEFLRSALALTNFDGYAAPAYEWAKRHRRLADDFDPLTGVATLGGESFSGADVVNVGTVESPIYTVPSEFADADDA